MEHPITPPPELLQQWYEECHKVHEPFLVYIANQAARWGADQELEACCEWLDFYSAASDARDLRIARRPKPPSLKEQALAALGYLQEDEPNYQSSFDTIRRALEALPND